MGMNYDLVKHLEKYNPILSHLQQTKKNSILKKFLFPKTQQLLFIYISTQYLLT